MVELQAKYSIGEYSPKVRKAFKLIGPVVKKILAGEPAGKFWTLELLSRLGRGLQDKVSGKELCAEEHGAKRAASEEIGSAGSGTKKARVQDNPESAEKAGVDETVEDNEESLAKELLATEKL